MDNNPERKTQENLESSALAYMKEKNKTLVNDYRTPDNNNVESCSEIAVDIAKILLDEGKRPIIVSVTNKEDGYLVPRQYEGRVKWGAHKICVCDGFVYDPMVGEPMSIEEYRDKVFENEVELEIKVAEDEVEKFINR